MDFHILKATAPVAADSADSATGSNIDLATDATSNKGDTPALHTLHLDNSADTLGLDLNGVQRVVLNFPKFTDGRAFSQAFVLRRRGFAGDIRASGDVLIDQLLQMRRCGFSSAVLRADQDAEHATRLLSHYKNFYQGDAVQAQPRFAA